MLRKIARVYTVYICVAKIETIALHANSKIWGENSSPNDTVSVRFAQHQFCYYASNDGFILIDEIRRRDYVG